MKKGFKECPFCANEIKEMAIKCQYCGEFLNDVKNEGKGKEKDKKKCPYCLNVVDDMAQRCPFCDESLDREPTKKVSSKVNSCFQNCKDFLKKEKDKLNSNDTSDNIEIKGINSKLRRTIIVIYFILTIPIFLIARFASGDESGIWYVLVPIIYVILTDILRGGVYYIDSGKYQLGIWNKIKSLLE